MWIKVLDLYKISPRFCVALLQNEYNKKLRDRWTLFQIKKQLRPQEGISVIDRNLGSDNKTLALRKRGEINEKQLMINIEDLNYFPKLEVCPVIFEELV